CARPTCSRRTAPLPCSLVRIVWTVLYARSPPRASTTSPVVSGSSAAHSVASTSDSRPPEARRLLTMSAMSPPPVEGTLGATAQAGPAMFTPNVTSYNTVGGILLHGRRSLVGRNGVKIQGENQLL